MDNPAPAPSAPHATRVLLVDDDTSILTVLALLLRQDGYEVDVAPDARSARRSAQTNRYDVALVDVRLRDARGPELAHELAEQHGLRGRIALMTAGTRPDMLPCLVKPFAPDAMLRLVSELAAQSPA